MENISGDNVNYNFVIVGTGNVGTHLTRELYKKGLQPLQIINRSPEKSKGSCS